MSAIRLRGATSGTTDVVAAAIAGDGVLALPSGTGTLATTAFVDAAVAAGGKVLQVVTATHATEVSTTSTSFVTSNLTATITPSSATSKILVLCTTNTDLSSSTAAGFIAIFRGTVAGTNIIEGTIYNSAGRLVAIQSLSILDSPNTTSAQTYTLGQKVNSGVTLSTSYANSLSTIILMEVGA